MKEYYYVIFNGTKHAPQHLTEHFFDARVPTDVRYFNQKARDEVGWAERQGAKRINVFVNSSIPAAALAAVVNACRDAGMPLKLWHYNENSGDYVPQNVGSQEFPIWERSKKYGTKMEQSTYKYLASYSRSKKMTDKEARDYISEEFGFSPEKIIIFRSAEVYNTAKDHMPKIAESYERVPVWCYPDRNYVHFSVCGKMYEVINGVLHKYEIRIGE